METFHITAQAVKRSLQDYYGNFVHKHGWKHIAPLLDVIAPIETEIQKRGLFVFTSHEILRVTPHETHADRMEDDILSITPDRSGFARVIYQNKCDRQALPIDEFLDRGGSEVSYESLVSNIIPYLERLAQKR
jgi:hypothetical protein